MKNSTKLGVNAVIVTVFTIAAVILINAIASKLDSKLPLKIDLTQDKIYEFSDHTKDIMKELDKDIAVYALYPSNTNSNQYITYAEEYLAKYSALSSHFKVTFIDPYTNPNFAKKYESRGEAINAGSVIMECGENVEVVTMDEMYRQNQYTGSMSIDMEKKMTAAIVNVTGKGNVLKAYFAEGHNEYPSNELRRALTENGFACESVQTVASGIPGDCDMLIYMAPTTDITAEERDGLDKYLDGGGKAMFFFEPGAERPEKLSAYLKEWGIEVRNDYVIETDRNHAFRLQNGLTVAAPELLEHDINSSLIEQKMVFMAPMASSVVLSDNNVRHAKTTPLLSTTDKAYAKTFPFTDLNYAAGDAEGKMILAALSENQGGGYGKVFVSGSLEMFETSGILAQSSYANGDFIMNTAGFMTDNGTSMDIRAKVISAETLTMSQSQVVLVWFVLQYILPLIIIAAGLWVWLKRRYK